MPCWPPAATSTARRLGGPSFAPTIAADALEGLSMKGNAWTPSPPAEQGRRSVYMFTKRGLLPPLLTTFDFPDTTLPCCQRDVTTVAPQALALLEQPVRPRAERVASPGDDCHDTRGWSTDRRGMATGAVAKPSDAEKSAAKQHTESQRRHFVAAGHKPADAELWAWTSLCHVLLNTNEFMYVD